MVPADAPRALLHVDLGLVDYDEAHAFQRAAARLRARNELADDLLILCEHPAIVTLGRSSKAQHVLASAAALAERGVALREVERGGDVTVHEPGQLVGYPIVNLLEHRKDLHWYLRQVEEALMQAMATIGLHTERSTGQTGVWIDGRKLASIGVHAREWVTSHGFALNASNTLSTFQWIVPCGIAGVEMTTVARECARAGLPVRQGAALRADVIDAFARVFARSARAASPGTVDAIRAEALNVRS